MKHIVTEKEYESMTREQKQQHEEAVRQELIEAGLIRPPKQEKKESK